MIPVNGSLDWVVIALANNCLTAAAAGRSMEEEARTILSDAISDQQLVRQRAWVKEMKVKRRELFGDQVFPDSSELFREMRDERTRQIEEWALPKDRSRKK